MKIQTISFFIALSVWAPMAFSSAPQWTTQMAQSQSGSIFTSVCEGEGPSADTARDDAVRHCKASAAEQLGSKVQVQALAIRTESQSAFNQEISETGTYEGLVCNPKNTYSEQENGHFRFWIKCDFDLSEAKRVPGPQSSNSNTNSAGAQARLLSLSQRSGDVLSIKSDATIDRSRTIRISVISIPACDDMLIRGSRARKIQCHDNPNDVDTTQDDTEIIVRKNGYSTKTITLKDLRETAMQTVTVVLDPL